MGLKPLFIARPSGLFVRFFVPTDLRAQVGSRYIVRSLGDVRGHRAHLIGYGMAVALSQAFAGMRRGDHAMTDLKRLLEIAERAVDSGKSMDWQAESIKVGGLEFRNVVTKGKQDTQDFIDTVKQLVGSSVASPVVATDPQSPMLGALIDEYLADIARRGLAPDTITESRHTLRILLGIVGDKPIAELTRNDLRAFWDGVRWWPKHATVKAEYRHLSVLEIIEQGKAKNLPEPSPLTLTKHRQRLSAFFNDLVDAKTLAASPLTKNMLKVSSDEEETGRPFTDGELKKIFNPTTYLEWAAKYPHRYWGPVLGLYSGARLTEVAQLYVEDIEQIDGIWGFHVNNRFYGQKIKNRASRRFIPLAQPVLDAGFLAFVASQRKAKQERLFPDLPVGVNKETGKLNGTGYGRQLSRQFGAYLKKLGIEEGVAFHAFRHTFATAMNRAKKTELETARITGHKVQGSVLSKHYIDPPTLPERVETLKAFKPPVEIPRMAF